MVGLALTRWFLMLLFLPCKLRALSLDFLSLMKWRWGLYGYIDLRQMLWVLPYSISVAVRVTGEVRLVCISKRKSLHDFNPTLTETWNIRHQFLQIGCSGISAMFTMGGGKPNVQQTRQSERKTSRQTFIQEKPGPYSPKSWTQTHTRIGPPFPVASLQYRHMVKSCTPSDPDRRQQSTLGNTANASLMFGPEGPCVFLQDETWECAALIYHHNVTHRPAWLT